jgi:hypothetical protein
MRTFENKFTLDGLVRPPKGVTPESVKKVAALVAEAKNGSFVAEAQLKESMMTGVLAASVAHFINIITIPQLPDDKDRPVAKIAGFRTVGDFKPAVLYGLFGSLSGPGVESDGAAAIVPQGTPYPEVTISGLESAYGKLKKRGNRINWDFEDFINDTVGVLDGLPAQLRDVALETEWQEVGDALVMATTELTAQVLPDATSVPVNAPVSANAIMAAVQALALRTVNGTNKKIGTLSGYNVIVPVGKKPAVDYDIRKALGITAILPSSSGGAVYIGPDNSILNTIEVIEHDKVTGTKWYLAPKPGAYSRPVLDVLRLRGYEQPQIRVRQEGGDGFSFDADTAAMRLRLVTGGVLWFQEAVVYSEGDGDA